jgi:ProP effector
MNFNTAHATIELLAATWPACFAVSFRDRKPLKIGIGKEVAALVEGAVTQEELDAALGLYTRQKAYLKALKEGAARVDLDGNPAGVVTAAEAALARRHIERINARASARTRAGGLAIEEAKRAFEEAKRQAEIAAGKRKPMLRLPRSAVASVAAQAAR